MCLVNRRGLGKAKHVDMQNLWIHGASKSKRFVAKKVGTNVIFVAHMECCYFPHRDLERIDHRTRVSFAGLVDGSDILRIQTCFVIQDGHNLKIGAFSVALS